MLSKQVVFVLSLVVLVACEFKERPYFNEKFQGLQKRQIPKCQDCNPPLLSSLGTLQVQGITASLTKLGPFLQKLTTLLADISNKLFGSTQELMQAIRLVLVAISDDNGNVIDELSTALQKIITCPSLPAFLASLKVNLQAVITTIQNNFQPLIDAKDIGSVIVGLGNALKLATPNIMKLIQDLVPNVLGLIGQCKLLVLISPALSFGLPTVIPTVIGIVTQVGNSIKGTGAVSLSDLLKNLGAIGGIPGIPAGGLSNIVKTLLQTSITSLNSILGALNGGAIENLIPANLGNLLSGFGLNIDVAGINSLLTKLVAEISSGGGGALGNIVKTFVTTILDIVSKIQGAIAK